jgi:hypothetical protein
LRQIRKKIKTILLLDSTFSARKKPEPHSAFSFSDLLLLLLLYFVQYSYTFLARTSRSLAEVEEHSENSERIRIFQFVFVAPLDRIEKARGFFQWRRDNKKNSTELCKKQKSQKKELNAGA